MARGSKGRRRKSGKRKNRNKSTPSMTQQLIAASATATSYRLPRVLDPKELHVRRDHSITISSMYVAGQQITFSTAVPNGYSFMFILTDIPDYADYTAAFDQYKVLQLSYYFEPRGTFTAGTIYTVVDYDDNNPPTTVSELMEYETCQLNNYGTAFFRVVNPRIAQLVYAGVTPSYSTTRAWVDCVSSSVQHYGLKVITDLASNNGAAWDVRIRAVVSFRNKR